jgi:ribose 5-phosphate isomerase B
MYDKELVIGCDNAAVGLMKEIKAYLTSLGIPFQDMGVQSTEDDTPYPNIAQEVVDEILRSHHKKEGILICGTGIGMSITANKNPGIYAAVCHDTYSAERARLSNNTNILCMGARVVGPELAKKIVNEWLNLEFQGGRSSSKVQIIEKIERQNFK